MKFLSVEVRDFFSHEHTGLNLDGLGTVFVKGINRDSVAADGNGAGKSSLVVEPILWCLFGRTARGVSGSAVVKKGSTRGTSVVTHWQSGDRVYRVRRCQNHHAQGNSLLFSYYVHTGPEDEKGFRPGKNTDLTQTDKRRTQEEIVKTLGFDFNTALYAMVMGQSSLSFADATDSQRKEVFESILQFDVLIKARNKAKDKVSSISAELAVQNTRSDYIKQQTNQKGERLTELAVEVLRWEKKKREAQNVLRHRLSVLSSQNQSVKALSALVEIIDSEIAEVAINERTERELREKILLTRQVITNASEGADSSYEIKKLKESCVVKDACPRCGQKLPSRLLREEESRAREDKKRLRFLEGEIAEKEEEVSDAKKRLTSLSIIEEEYHNKHKVVNALATEREHHTRKIDLTSNLSSNIAECKAKLEALENEVCPSEAVMKELEADLRTLEDELAVLDTGIRGIKKSLNIFKFWEVGFGRKGLQSFILDTTLPFLTYKATEYANMLCGGDVQIQFSTTSTTASGKVREDFSVNCVNRSGADIYKGQSGGEKNKIDLAVALAMQDLLISRFGAEFNLGVFDEAVPNTDREGVERFVKLVKSLDRSTIFIVSHNPFYEDYFPNRLVVVKEDGVSRIEEHAN